ncbi:MAG: hypothetical protein M5U30_10960 [Burkholderiaceae bacterium]|nr:hypothetical protein [Burkholderiaceae bacterium]
MSRRLRTERARARGLATALAPGLAATLALGLAAARARGLATALARACAAVLALGVVAALGVAPAPAAAAPFDYALTARPEQAGARQFEVAVDAMNDTLDVFDIRGRDPVYGGTNVGDYTGAHLRGGWKLAERWWIDAALWRRKIEYRNDSGSLTSWQLAAQYRFAGDAGDVGGGSSGATATAAGPTGGATAWALRGSVWGNRSGTLDKRSPTALAGYTMDSVAIDSPRDLQWQFDVIATRGGADASVSGFVGIQRGKVDYSRLSGTATAGTCPYAVAFGDSTTVLTQTADCTGSGGTLAAGTQVTVDNSALGLNPRDALAYTATVLRAGVNAHKRWGAWQLRGGLAYEHHDRGNALEDAAQSLSGTYESGNLSAALELGYRFTPTLTGFVRGTAWQHQLMGEVPFLYNAVTARRSDRRYGIVSVGVSASF